MKNEADVKVAYRTGPIDRNVAVYINGRKLPRWGYRVNEEVGSITPTFLGRGALRVLCFLPVKR